MQTQKGKSETGAAKDDDIQFDRDNITTTDSQSTDPELVKTTLPENAILPEQDLLDPNPVVPLTEEEKQPKLPDDEPLKKDES